MKPYLTIGLLVISNIFMTFAWYGQLRLKGQRWFDNLPLLAIILLCWGVALFEYMFQVPANRIGFRGNGGPFYAFPAQGDSGGGLFDCIYGFRFGLF